MPPGALPQDGPGTEVTSAPSSASGRGEQHDCRETWDASVAIHGAIGLRAARKERRHTRAIAALENCDRRRPLNVRSDTVLVVDEDVVGLAVVTVQVQGERLRSGTL